MKGLRYALVLGLTLVALGVAAAFVIVKLRAGLTGAETVAAGPRTTPQVPVAPPPPVQAPPPPPAPAAPAPPPSPPPTSAVRRWHPSPEQVVRDSVYLLGRANRQPEAAALLNRWIAAHPADTTALHASARLLIQTGREDEAFARYRTLLERDSSATTRAEYAAALLAAGRYDEAAVEYRRLLADDPDNAEYRLGLGRALAWGGHPREATLELARGLTPGDTAAAQLLRATRLSYQPSSEEAAAWLRESPDDPGYRLALVGALVREAHAAHDSTTAARLLGQAVALAPADTALRHQYARALTWSGDYAGAIREYSALIERDRDPDLLFARGQLYLWSGNDRAAEADLLESAQRRPRYETYALLGDLYRWRGDTKKSVQAYQEALVLRPGDNTALAGVQTARREAKGRRRRDEDEGLASTTRFLSDNAGFDFVSSEVGAGVGFGEANRTIVFASGDVRRVSRDTVTFPGPRHVDGFWVQGGVAQWIGRLRASARAGLLHHEDVPDIGTWGVSGELVERSAHVRVGLSRSAAYETLRAGRTLGLAVAPGTDPALKATTLVGSVSIPFRNGAELWLAAEHLWLSDDNERTSLNLAVRYPLIAGFAAVYSGGGLGFGDLAPEYWSPDRYLLQAVGLEYRVQRPSGFTLALRGLPGVAFLRERAVADGPAASRSVFQWSVALDLAYRRPRWELGAYGSYGRDRSDAGYEAGGGLFRLRWYW